MIIKRVEQCDMELYNKRAREYGTIFNTLEWLSLFGDRIQIHGIYHKGGDLIGGFITYRENKFGLSIYCNPPYTPTIGPFLRLEAENPVTIMDTWKEALSLMAEFIENIPVSIVSFSLDKSVIDTQPFIWKKYKVITRYTYLLDLSMPIESILKRMSTERRKNINKGLRDGLTVEKVEDLEQIIYLVTKTFTRQKKKIDTLYLRKILFDFANSDNSFAFLTLNRNTPIACSFYIYDRYTAYYLLGGYNNENKHHGAGALSMWEAIKYAKTLGLRYFDFEGSMIPQIETYFRGFGGQLTPYYTVNKAILPIEIFLKFFRRELF